MDRGAWQAPVHRIRVRHNRLSTLAHTQHKLQYIFCTLALQNQGNTKTQDIAVLHLGFESHPPGIKSVSSLPAAHNLAQLSPGSLQLPYP